MSARSNLWDIKSKTYPKFSGKLSPFQENFFKVLEEFHIDFSSKTLIDIGCGTGFYTLYLARFCKEILAIDSSKGMLDELNAKAKEFSNIKTLNCSFDELNFNDKFDIAFLTMSPAIKTELDFKKFITIAKTKIYLNWSKPRYSTLIEPFFKEHNVKKELIIDELAKFLKQNKIEYKSRDFLEKREITKTLDEAVDSVLWHLEMSGVRLAASDVRAVLQDRVKDGFITDHIESNMRLLVF